MLSQIKAAFWPDIEATAAHEIGHAIVGSHVGLEIKGIELLHGGRAGCTTTVGYVADEDYLLVAVAGFVAEEMYKKHGMVGFTKPQYAMDYKEARELVGDDIEAINKAIADVHAYLNQPEITQFSKYLVDVLIKKGKLNGDMVKIPC